MLHLAVQKKNLSGRVSSGSLPLVQCAEAEGAQAVWPGRQLRQQLRQAAACQGMPGTGWSRPAWG